MDFNLQMPLENSLQLFLKPCQQPATVPLPDRLHINILIPSMVLGGAERIVHDVLNSLAQTEVTANLILLWDREPMYPLNNLKNVQIIRLQGLRRFDKLRTITLEVLRSPSPVIYSHLILTRELAYLWNAGILTIPVIHNSKEGWLEPPHHYNHQQVPFIITCCDTVTQQIQETECTKPVITIRHELYSKGNTVNFFRNRSYIREKYNISDSTFLIGMVGQFKPQKAYFRAIEILGVAELGYDK